MTPIAPILKSLGLLESEIRTYLAALENGAGTAADLAKQAKLSRQAVYTAIEALTERGIMTSVEHGKKRLYAAEDPEKLLAYARRRESEMKEHIKDLERSIPELKLQIGGERPVVRMFEGKEGIRAIIEEMKKSKPKHSEEITDLEAMYTILSPQDLLPMRLQMKEIGTHIQGLYAGKPSAKVASSMRFVLPKEFANFQSDITIFDNKIALVTFEGKMYSVLVESDALAKTLRILFQLAYRTARKEFPSA